MSITEGQLEKRGKYWHWRYRVDGQPKKRTLKVTQLADAKRLRQALIAQYNEDSAKFLQESKNPTIEDFWVRFESWSRDHKKEGTLLAESKAWKKLIHFSKAKRIGDITPELMENFKAQLKNKGVQGRPLKDATTNHIMRHLKAIFNQGIELGYFTGANPVAKVKLYKIPKTTPAFLTKDEVDRLMAAAKSHSRNMHWVFLLGIYLGLRKNEIANASWEWFDLDKKLVTVKISPTFQIKDAEERTIPMPDVVHAELLPHRQPSGYLFNSGRQSKGKYQYRYEPKKSFQAVAQAANVPQATFQLLRHTFGSQLAQAGVSLYKVSKWMGHSSVDVTAKHYAGLQSYDDDINRI